MSEHFLIVIAGPTAVGKTELCVRLAKNLNCDIISSDSRQFFKELSIGTAKPSPEEMHGIRHHFIDFISIDEEFSAGKFEVATLQLLSKLFQSDRQAILTGGSGLYIQAVCQGMNDIPDVDLSFRDELYSELAIHGLKPLLEELRIKDPSYFKIVDKLNPQRVVRALEVCRGTGNPYSAFRADKKADRNFRVIKIGLNREREELFNRINLRVAQMMDAGLVDEVKSVREKRQLNALKTVGYKEIFEYLDGNYDLDEAIRLLKRNTRRYAKRQLTWFKKDPAYTWFHPDEMDQILEYIHLQMNPD